MFQTALKEVTVVSKLTACLSIANFLRHKNHFIHEHDRKRNTKVSSQKKNSNKTMHSRLVMLSSLDFYILNLCVMC